MQYYIFIDEIQYVDDFSSIIKYLVDHYADTYKLILSGSSSIQIKHKFKDSLVGRKIVFELFPLSFSEFCRFTNEATIAEKLEKSNFIDIEMDPLKYESVKLERMLNEYMVFGGLPGVALHNNTEKNEWS